MNLQKTQLPDKYNAALFNGCELAITNTHASLLPELKRSLLRQSKQLGVVTTEEISKPLLSGGLAFTFKTPKTSPIKGLISAWHDSPDKIASENILQAASGMMSVHGRAQGQVLPLALPYISTMTASLALQGIFAGALGQLRGLNVTRCETSMMSAGLMAIGQYIAGATSPEGAEQLLPDDFSVSDHPPFQSADKFVFELETLSPEPWKNFWQRVGINGQIAGKGWSAFLMRYAKAVAPLPREMKAALAGLPYSEIQQHCNETGVAICPVRTSLQRQSDPDFSQLSEQGPWHFNQRSFHNWQHSTKATNKLPLSGIKVVEACRRIQGPMASHLLALLGATVIRIEPPGGDPLRGMFPIHNNVSVRFDALNRLKETIEIDIKTLSGQQQVKELISTSDVFLHNWAPGKAAQFKLDSNDMRQINPHLIYAYAGGWGSLDQQLSLPGTDFMVQAYSGLANNISQHARRSGGSLFTVLDILGGVTSSQGVISALLARELSGEVSRVDTSLLGTACLLDTQPEKTENELLLNINDNYPTAEGILCLECLTEESLSELLTVLTIAKTSDKKTIKAHLSQKLQTKKASEWVSYFDRYFSQKTFTKQAMFTSAEVIVDLKQLVEQAESRQCLSYQKDSYARVKNPWTMGVTTKNE